MVSDEARSFNQWERTVDRNIVIINHSFRQPIGYLPRPKYIPHKLSWFLLFCCRSPKNRLKYRYRHNFSLYSLFLVLHSPSTINCFLFPLPFAFWFLRCSLFPAPCSLPPVLCSLFSVPSSLLSVPCSLYPCSTSLLRSLFPVPRSRILIPFFLFSKFEVNEARQTNRQSKPSSRGRRTSLLESSCFIQLPRSTFASLYARRWSLFHIYSSSFIYVRLFEIQIYPFLIFFLLHTCISVNYLSLNHAFMLNHKQYNFLDCDWFEKLTFSIYLPVLFRTVCYRTIQ